MAEERKTEERHDMAYFVPRGFRDGRSRCTCGWMSKRTSPGHANAAWARHARRLGGRS